MVPSSNLKPIYYGREYTFLPNLGEIEGGEGVRINQNMSKIGRIYIEKEVKSGVALTAHISETTKATENLI